MPPAVAVNTLSASTSLNTPVARLWPALDSSSMKASYLTIGATGILHSRSGWRRGHLELGHGAAFVLLRHHVLLLDLRGLFLHVDLGGVGLQVGLLLDHVGLMLLAIGHHLELGLLRLLGAVALLGVEVGQLHLLVAG